MEYAMRLLEINKTYWTYFVLLLAFEYHVFAQNEYDPSRAYCFRFTWLGPKYDNESTFQNATCEDIIGEKATVPCNQPLIATANSHLPDTAWIWNNFKGNISDIACRLSPSDVCVKYTFIYNHAVENITYMCSKVTIEDKGAVESDCYTEVQNGREIEVCVCKSSAGQIPCNAATTTTVPSSLGLMTAIGLTLPLMALLNRR